MLQRSFICLAACVIASASTAAEDRDVFKWTNTDGQVIYSDRPQENDAERLDIKSKATDNARISAVKQAQIEKAQADRLKSLENVQVAESADEEASRFAENCRRAREALKSLEEASRLYLPTDDGGRRFLTEEETELRVAKARKDVGDWCK